MANTQDRTVRSQMGHTRVKLVLYFFLFSLCMFTGSAVITMASLSGMVGGNINVIYEAPPSVTLLTGEEFGTAMKAPMGKIYNSSDTAIKTVTFDYMSTDYDEIVASASVVTPVDVNKAGDAMMYHVGDSTNGYNIYVLANDVMLANEDSSCMFYYCRYLETIIFDNFDTSIVKNFYRMFSDCYHLQNIDVSNFETVNATSMLFMFEQCEILEHIDVSNFDTSNVNDMRLMFSGCTGLTELDISNFDTSSLIYSAYMFANSTALKTIYVGSGWNMDAVTVSTEMFNGCTSLVGGNGTVYDSNYVDHTYARVDTAEAPGYFTLKS